MGSHTGVNENVLHVMTTVHDRDLFTHSLWFHCVDNTNTPKYILCITSGHESAVCGQRR